MKRRIVLLIAVALLVLPLVFAAGQQGPQVPQPARNPQGQPPATAQPAQMGPGSMMRQGMMRQGMPQPAQGPAPMMQQRMMQQGMRQQPGQGSGPMIPPRILQELNLTAEQKGRIQQLDFQRRKAEIQNRADLETRQLELKQLLGADKPDRAAVERKLAEIGSAMAAQMKTQTMSQLDVMDVLTAEQRAKARDLRERGATPPNPPQPAPVAPRPAQAR